MSNHLHFELVSPEKLLVSEEVAMVTVPGGEGDFGVLPGHAPITTTRYQSAYSSPAVLPK